MNRGGGYDLKASCIYHLYGLEAYFRCLKELLEASGGVAGDLSIEEGPEETRSQPFAMP